jgi:hypothetical protein
MPITQSSASMTCTQQMVATIEATDTEGNATDPNTIVWTSSDEAVAVVVPEKGGLTCNVIAGSPGTCKVVVNANAGKGTKGTKPVLGILNLTVTSGELAGVKIETESPVEQGTAPDQGLPSRPPRPDQGLPSGGAHPDQGLPSGGARPDQGLPNAPARPDAGLPPVQGRPDQGLPNAPARPDQGLPSGSGRPDQGLPPTPEPKKK